MILGDLIRIRRQELGLSQTEVATRAGTSQSHLSKIERGLQSVRGAMLEALESILDTNLRDEAQAQATPDSTQRRLIESWYPAIPDRLDRRLTIDRFQWQRPPAGESGDFQLIETRGQDGVFFVAGDVAGHGHRAARPALYLEAWLSGWLANQQTPPRLEICAEALDRICGKIDVNVSVAIGLVTRHGDAPRNHEIEVLTLGYPDPLLLVGPPGKTPPPRRSHDVGQLGRTQGTLLRWSVENFWQLALFSDGLVRRLGASSEKDGRRALRRLLDARGESRLSERLETAPAALVDDESILLLSPPKWDVSWTVPCRDRKERERVLGLLEDRVQRPPTDFRRTDALLALAIPIENVIKHAHVVEYEIRARFDQGSVVVEIVDEGPGMPRGSVRRGLKISEALSDDLYVRPNHPTGTIVGLVFKEGPGA